MRLTKDQQDLVTSHLHIAKRVAQKFATKQPHVPYEDLYSICLESLCIAASKYQPGTTYAKQARLTANCDVLNYLQKENGRRAHETLAPQEDEDSEDSSMYEPSSSLESPEALYAVKEYLDTLSEEELAILDLANDGYSDTAIGYIAARFRHTVRGRRVALGSRL